MGGIGMGGIRLIKIHNVHIWISLLKLFNLPKFSIYMENDHYLI